MEADELITVSFESEEAAKRFNSDLHSVGSEGDIVKRENLDGDAITWIVVANTAVSALPKIIESLAKLIEVFRARSVRVGDREIRNPEPGDVRSLAKPA
jgi:hypothetical protein